MAPPTLQDLHDGAAVLLQLAHQLGQKIRAIILLVLLLLVLATMVLLVPTMMLLLMPTVILLLVPAVLLLMAVVVLRPPRHGPGRGHDGLPALQIDQDAPRVLLVGGIVEPELAAQLLDGGLELLHAARAVVPLADDGVQVRDAGLLVGAHAGLEDALGLLDELPVQVDLVRVDVVAPVVGPEDEVGRLPVVVVHARRVRLALVREGLGRRAVAVAVRGLRPLEAAVALLGLGAGEVAEAVVLALRLVVFAVGAAEGCDKGLLVSIQVIFRPALPVVGVEALHREDCSG